MQELTKRKRLAIAIIAGLAIAALVGPQARVAIVTHDSADAHPHKVEASVGVGKLALSLLFTWTAQTRAR